MPWINDSRIYAKPSGSKSTSTYAEGVAEEISQEGTGQFELGKYGYGKNDVKLLFVHRQGSYHTIREYEVCTELKLSSQNDYLKGDNKDIIATDSQKNTVYLLAKKHGVKTPEEFGMLVCGHFLYTYKQVVEVSCLVRELPWERLGSGTPHNHAFVFSPTATRWSQVSQKRNERVSVLSALSGLRLLKTTQSSFVDFVQDEYTTLTDAAERIFSTMVEAQWEYSSVNDTDFDNTWLHVKESILDNFAGPPETGVASPSVQHTLYNAERMVLEKAPEIAWIKMIMPNKHYHTIDLSKFPANVMKGDPDHHIYQPVDKPAGLIHAQLRRRVKSRL